MADGPDLRSKPTGQSYLPCPTLDWIGPPSLAPSSISTLSTLLLGSVRKQDTNELESCKPGLILMTLAEDKLVNVELHGSALGQVTY